jgi:uncharacterized tellurite resistance protein B-like protein
MFFRKEPSAGGEPRAWEALVHAVRGHLAEGSPEEVEIVAAIVGLFGAIAYADHELAPAEEGKVRAELLRIHGLSDASVVAICALLRDRIAHVAHETLQTYTRVLKEGTDRTTRLDVLDALIEVAAADGVLSLDETNLLRRVTSALGLSADDYVALQSRHRDKLAVLG